MLNGGMGFDIKKLAAKGSAKLQEEAKKAAVKEAQKQIDKYKPKEAAPITTPAGAVAALEAKTGFSKETLMMMAGGGLAAIILLTVLIKMKNKKAKANKGE